MKTGRNAVVYYLFFASQKPVAAKIINEIFGNYDDVKNLSQIWAVAPALVKLALRDVQQGQTDKEPPWKRIAKGLG
jgi:hypothetical protein